MGALEHHMLEQMGKAIVFGPLEPRAGFGGERDSSRFKARQCPACHPESAGDGGDLGFGHLQRARSAT